MADRTFVPWKNLSMLQQHAIDHLAMLAEAAERAKADLPWGPCRELIAAIEAWETFKLDHKVR